MACSAPGLEWVDLDAPRLDFARLPEHPVDAGLAFALVPAQQLERVEALGPQQPEADAAHRPGLLQAGDEAVLEVQAERELQLVHAPGPRAVVPEQQRPLPRRLHLRREAQA